MTRRRHNTSGSFAGALLLAAVAMVPAPGSAAVQTKGTASSRATVQPAAPAVPSATIQPSAGVLVDQVIAVVNGDLILESDIDQDRRFAVFQPLSDRSGFSRDKIIDRLIDRMLILQQAVLNPADDVSPEEATAQLLTLRKDIPECKPYLCDTDEGWKKFVQAQGFTLDELTRRWQERMEILKFIEMRFRMGIQVLPAEIKTYYDETLLPQYAERGAKPPPLEVIADRIQEILLQRRVSALLVDWLKQLKAQGSVQVMRPGEVQP